MRLVKKHLPTIPIPAIYGHRYRYKDGVPYAGELAMEFIPGRDLKSAWAGLDDSCKDRVCQDTWALAAQIRTIPRPMDLSPVHYRTIDGSPSRDPLIASSNDVPPRDMDDETLQSRIWALYVATHGLSLIGNLLAGSQTTGSMHR